MGIVWQKNINGKQYEVRSAGQTRRLYTDGVFHTQYNPTKTLTANVWDLISLPSFFLADKNIRRILVLGVGGGAVIRQFLQWYPHAEITGVELDKTHISIGKRFFGLRNKRVTLFQADAVKWVNHNQGLRYDIIIDDLFGEKEGEPSRVVEANAKWIVQLSRLLSAHGQLVINFTESKDLRNCAIFHSDVLRKKFKTAFRLMTPLYENQIGVFLRQESTVNEWRNRIKQHELRSEFEQCRDKYQVRRLKLY